MGYILFILNLLSIVAGFVLIAYTGLDANKKKLNIMATICVFLSIVTVIVFVFMIWRIL